MADYYGGEHEHKFFVFKTFDSYELILGDDQGRYKRVEYAIVGCNCSSVKKVRIEGPES